MKVKTILFSTIIIAILGLIISCGKNLVASPTTVIACSPAGKGKKWWIGYKLDGVSEAVRQKLVQQASFSNLYKTVNEDDGAYDGGDVVFMPM